MTENENLKKQITDDLSAVLKEAKSMGCKEVTCFRHIPLQNVETVIQALEENQWYKTIGTIEEFKDLKEKSVAKKPTPIDYEKYMDVITNAKFLRGACWCPNCKHTVLSGVYCGNCGQKLDWSE